MEILLILQAAKPVRITCAARRFAFAIGVTTAVVFEEVYHLNETPNLFHARDELLQEPHPSEIFNYSIQVTRIAFTGNLLASVECVVHSTNGVCRHGDVAVSGVRLATGRPRSRLPDLQYVDTCVLDVHIRQPASLQPC